MNKHASHRLLANSPEAPSPNAILTYAQVAAWLQIHPRQVGRLGVPACKMGHKTIRYLVKDVLAWIENHTAAC